LPGSVEFLVAEEICIIQHVNLKYSNSQSSFIVGMHDDRKGFANLKSIAFVSDYNKKRFEV
jgi:hypothetical protein